MIPAVRIYPSSEASAVETLLGEAWKAGRKYTLSHKTAGVEPMFRAHKFANESWGVTFVDTNGSRNGRWFKTEAEARAMFALWTQA